MRHTVLPNGVTVATWSDPSASTVALALHVWGGARAQLPNEAGFAHLAEHVLMTDSAIVTDARELQSALFARMGGAINAFAGREHVAMMGHVRHGDARALLDHFIQRLLHVGFDPAAVSEEAARLAREAQTAVERNEGDLESILLEYLWGNHPLSNPMFPDSTVQIEALPAALAAYWKRVLVGPAVSVLAVGALEHEELLAAAQPLLTLPLVARPTCGPAPRLLPAPGTTLQCPPLGAGRMLWALPSDPFHVNAEVLGHLLCGTQHGQLYQWLRQYAVPVYGIEALHLTYSDGGLLAFSLQTPPGRHQDTAAMISHQLTGMAYEGIRADRYQDALASLQARKAIEAARLEHRLETLAYWVDLGGAERTEPASLEAFNVWLRQAWLQHVILEWPPV